MDYQDRIVMISGGSSGIGLASAKALAAMGAHVFVFSLDEPKQIEDALVQLGQVKAHETQRFGGIRLDVTDQDAVAKELDKAWQYWNAQLHDPMWIRQDARTEEPGQRGQGGGVEQRFRQMDRNDDGKLTADEVDRPGLFRRLDQDGDGVVTLDEAKKVLGARPDGAAVR